MKNYDLNSEKEEKNKKRGFFITFFVHSALLAMAFFPLMGAINDIELAENEVQYIELTDYTTADVDFVANAETKSRKNSSNEEPQTKEEPTPEKPAPEPTPEPEPKPTEVVNDDEAPTVATSEDHNANEVKQHETPASPKVTPDPNPAPNAKPSGNQSNTNKPGGTANANTDDSGDGGNDDELTEGVFGRRVMYRPNIKGLTKKKGKIAIKVCVSQEGTVIASKYLQKMSTITDPKLVANAVRAARRYKFDVDYTAPKKQWGKLTFIFDLDK